jgi:hypothetical protein
LGQWDTIFEINAMLENAIMLHQVAIDLFFLLKLIHTKLGRVVQTCNPGTQEAEGGES